jgi:hypothetical protein
MKTNRTWEQCLQEFEVFKQKNQDRILKIIPYFPLGFCLSVEEYLRFKSEGRNTDIIAGYCESGKNTHENVRASANWGIEHTLGLTTPRKGYYKVLAIDGEMLTCYYNHDRGDAFLQEEVEISSKPFFNRASIGPKATIKVGDIIQVDDTKLVERTWNGSSYTTYSVTWRFYNR